MYEIIDLLLSYGIPILGGFSVLLYVIWQFKIKAYLKSIHPEVFKVVFVAENDESKENEEWERFLEFTSKQYLELNDSALTEIIFEYKMFQFSFLIFFVLFITNLVLTYYLKS